MTFEDREHAGRLLAEELERFRAECPIVLGLTRGGVPAAYVVASALRAPLDVLVVRKLGAPAFPEYALGAVAEGGSVYLNVEAIGEAGLDEPEVRSAAERERAEVARRAREYREGRSFPDIAGRTVIVVDDGVATGATALAAARSLRQRRPGRLILAAPVIAAASEAELRAEFDEIVAVQTPAEFLTLRSWYDRFGQLSLEDVLEYLHRAIAAEPPESGNLGKGAQIEPASSHARLEEQSVVIPFGPSALGPGALEGSLSVPTDARGLVMFVHGSGSTRRSLPDRFVADGLHRAGFATLLFDLLTPEEIAEDALTRALRSDVELLTGRVVAALRWLAADPRSASLRIGCFGSNSGTAAVLAAAALRPELVAAVVSRGGRTDLVDSPMLEDVRAPVLLIVGGRDRESHALNRAAAAHLTRAEVTVLPAASHLFEESGVPEAVIELAADWFRRHLAQPSAVSRDAPA